MAKRFTDSDKYKKEFIRGLQGAYKLLWDYLYHVCDHAGIWYVDFEIAQIYIGKDMPVNEQDALTYFNNGKQRIIPLKGGKKWFIPSYVEFQYGVLNPTNKVHRSVISLLEKHGVDKESVRGLQAPKDKDKEKDKDKDKDKEKESISKSNIPFKEIIDDFNNVFNTNYRTDPVAGGIQKLIKARWKDKCTLKEFEIVHRKIKNKWQYDDKMRDYMRPQTLYTDNFHSYLNLPINIEEPKPIEKEQPPPDAERISPDQVKELIKGIGREIK